LARLLLVRHGLTDHNVNLRVAGYTDIEMNEEGLRQVEKLGKRLADEKIDAVYCSDLKRAVDTAKAAVSGRKVDITLSPELREMNFGAAEEKTFSELREEFPDITESVMNFEAGMSFPGGETFAEFVIRVRGFLKNIEKYDKDDTVLLVSHGGTLKILVCELLEIDQSHWYQMGIDNASLSIVNTYGDRTILNLLNDTSFLNDRT
jgi:broad specificity phosphatase PhoE